MQTIVKYKCHQEEPLGNPCFHRLHPLVGTSRMWIYPEPVVSAFLRLNPVFIKFVITVWKLFVI